MRIVKLEILTKCQLTIYPKLSTRQRGHRPRGSSFSKVNRCPDRSRFPSVNASKTKAYRSSCKTKPSEAVEEMGMMNDQVQNIEQTENAEKGRIQIGALGVENLRLKASETAKTVKSAQLDEDDSTRQTL